MTRLQKRYLSCLRKGHFKLLHKMYLKCPNCEEEFYIDTSGIKFISPDKPVIVIGEYKNES